MTTSVQLTNNISLASFRDERRELNPSKYYSHERHEQRREFRRESNERFFLQIVQSSDADQVGTTISSMAIDVSASGLKILTSQNLPSAAL